MATEPLVYQKDGYKAPGFSEEWLQLGPIYALVSQTDGYRAPGFSKGWRATGLIE